MPTSPGLELTMQTQRSAAREGAHLYNRDLFQPARLLIPLRSEYICRVYVCMQCICKVSCLRPDLVSRDPAVMH